jgi:glycosyltransferase involved in cell wall biosynthesis
MGAILARKPFVGTIATVLGSERTRRQAFVERVLLRRARAVVVNSHAGAVALQDRYGLSANVIPNAVAPKPLTASDPTQFGFASGPVVLCLARLAPEKNPASVVRAFSQIKNLGAKLVFVGSGPLETELKAAVRQLGLENRVRFLGSRIDGPALCGAADLVILASTQEGMPNALLEAQAAGRPVVATQVGGVSEIVTSGETGFLVPPGDDSALANALDKILSDEPLRKSMGGRARERSAMDHALSDHVARYVAVYRAAASS